MIVQKVKIYLAIMKKIGKYMPAPSRSKRFKPFDRKDNKVFEINEHILFVWLSSVASTNR